MLLERECESNIIADHYLAIQGTRVPVARDVIHVQTHVPTYVNADSLSL